MSPSDMYWMDHEVAVATGGIFTVPDFTNLTNDNFLSSASSCSFSDLDPFDYGFGFGSEYDSNLLPPSPLSTSSTLSSSSCSSAASPSFCASLHINYVEDFVTETFGVVIDSNHISPVSAYSTRCPKRKAKHIDEDTSSSYSLSPSPSSLSLASGFDHFELSPPFQSLSPPPPPSPLSSQLPRKRSRISFSGEVGCVASIKKLTDTTEIGTRRHTVHSALTALPNSLAPRSKNIYRRHRRMAEVCLGRFIEALR